jgi:hypothetical protein
MNKKTLVNRLVSLYVVFVMVFACFAVISFVNSPVKASLSMSDVVAYWNFEENTGTTTVDKKGSVITMNQTTSVGWATGKVGYCWNGTAAGCDAQSNPVYSSTFNVLLNSTAWSVEFWAKASGAALNVDFSPFIDHGDSGGAGNWQIICGGSGYFDDKMVFYTSGWANAIASNTSIPGDANWHHFVFAYGGTSSSDGSEWYIDGAVAGHTISLTLTNFTTLNKPMRLFKEYWSAASHQIYMDEVVIYNKKLSSSNVTQRWNSGYGQNYTFTGPSPPDSPPVFIDEDPVNESTCVDYADVSFSIDVNQAEGKEMTINFTCFSNSSISKREYFESEGSYTSVYGTIWRAQTFTTTDAYYITSASMKAARVGTGSIGDVTLSIRETSVDDVPTGSDLVAETVDGNGWSTGLLWHDFDFDSPVLLSASTMYAVVVRAPSGTTSNYLRWNAWGSSNPYADGTICTSTGVNWVISSSADALFRTYGYEYDLISTSSASGYNGTYSLDIGVLSPDERYYVTVSANTSSSNYTNETYWFETGDNTPPYYSDLSIMNESTGVGLDPNWRITLTDDESTFNYTIECSSGNSTSANGASSGEKTLSMVGLATLTEYTVWVNVTDLPQTCGEYDRNWSFTFTTRDAGSPDIDLEIAPETPAWIDGLPGVIWFRCNISEEFGAQMHYYFDTPGVGVSDGLSYNGTIGYNLTGLFLSTSYTTYVNVTNGAKWTNVSRTFTTRGNTAPTIGVPTPANNTIDKPIGSFVWSVPLTDADGDNVNFTVNCSNGEFSSGQVVSGNSATLSLTGPLAYYTVYTVWVNITDPFGSTNRAIYYFTTMVYGGGGGGGGLIHNTHVTFHFTNVTDDLDYSTLVFSDEFYNGTAIATIPHYVSGGDLVLNLSSAVVGAWFTVVFTEVSGVYLPFTDTRQFVANTTYDLLLLLLDPSYVFENKWLGTGRDLKDNPPGGPPWAHIDIWTDKIEYLSGEQIILAYHLPAKSWFTATGKDWLDYRWVIRDEPLGWWGNIWTSPDTTFIMPNSVYPKSLAYDSWQYIYIYANSAYLGTIPDGVTKYYVDFTNEKSGINDVLTRDPSPTFKVRGDAIIPAGTIWATNPVSPMPGQNFYMNFTSNNNGHFSIMDALNPSTNPVVKEFNKQVVNFTFSPVTFPYTSVWRVSMYVSDGDDDTLVDTIDVVVGNATNTSMGGNLEYLQMSQDRYVSGLHHAVIYYHTKAAWALITVKMPNGETSMYGINTTLLQGIYNFSIPSYAQIGKWDVTMNTANGSLSTYFYVVADDDNYVEFSKNVYKPNEPFVVYLTKTVNCVLIFYMADIEGNYVAQGERVYFEAADGNGIMSVPLTYVVPVTGKWRVEMWQTDYRIQIRKLATYDATVTVVPDTSGPGDDSILPSIGDPVLGAVIGLIITIFMTLSPFIVVRALNSNIDVPELVYAIMGGLGVFISVMFGFFPMWTIPFILTLGIIVSVLLYLMNKRGQGGGGGGI